MRCGVAGITGLVAFAALSLPVQAQQDAAVPVSPAVDVALAEGRVFEPDGEWVSRRSSGRCAVIRDFRQGDREVALQLQRMQPGVPTQFVLIGAELESDESVVAGFLPGAGLATFNRIGAARRGQTDAIFFVGPMFPGGAAAGGEGLLSLRAEHFVAYNAGGEPVILRTGAIDGALLQLQECARRELTDLGVDMANRDRYTQHPILVNADELGRPLSRMRRDMPFLSGAMVLRVVLDGDAQVVDCRASDDLLPRTVRDAACAIFSDDARFIGGVNAEGRFVTDYYLQRIDFERADLSGWPNADGTSPVRPR